MRKRAEQGYQDYALGLRVLVDELAAVGSPLTEEMVTLHLIAGMTSDRRNDIEYKEVSDRAEPLELIFFVLTLHLPLPI